MKYNVFNERYSISKNNHVIEAVMIWMVILKT